MKVGFGASWSVRTWNLIGPSFAVKINGFYKHWLLTNSTPSSIADFRQRTVAPTRDQAQTDGGMGFS